MTRLFTALSLIAITSPASAQVPASVAGATLAKLEALPVEGLTSSSLPDAPQPTAETMPDDQQAPTKTDLQPNVPPTAGRYALVILPGQSAVPLHGMQKTVYGLHEAFNPLQLVGITVSAGFSHLIDSAPHYGTNSEAFGKREGAAALRSTIQTISTTAVFSPMFHDDPRYYAMGKSQSFPKRVIYAASRVLVTQSSHSTNHRVNAPLLLGYGVAAGVNNAYYPDRDRGFGPTMQSYVASLGGAALGFEVDEFLDDALRIVHLRK